MNFFIPLALLFTTGSAVNIDPRTIALRGGARSDACKDAESAALKCVKSDSACVDCYRLIFDVLDKDATCAPFSVRGKFCTGCSACAELSKTCEKELGSIGPNCVPAKCLQTACTVFKKVDDKKDIGPEKGDDGPDYDLSMPTEEIGTQLFETAEDVAIA